MAKKQSHAKSTVKKTKLPGSFFEGEFKLPELEERVLKFWKDRQIFEQSVDPRRNKGKEKFVFFEGPPTANGQPGIHHVLARSFKDVIPRFQTMRGKFVPRKSGWDTHGLPVEIQVEKELGLKSKKEIEEYGIAAFNRKCRESVWRYQEEFEKLTERMGFWLDLEKPYITYQNSYIESLWSILAEFSKRGLLYQGHKVVPWCPRCGTSLSSHELAQGYKEVEETSVYMKFQLLPGQKIGPNFRSDGKTYILSWTTTPWTLPGNVALAIDEKVNYALVETANNEKYILAEALADSVLRKSGVEKYEIKNILPGKNLIGLQYNPLFHIPSLETDRSHRVYPANFVTTTDGTGVVHTAVMYGEDDYQLGVKVGLPQKHTVTERGVFTEEVQGLVGAPAKNKDSEEKILRHLEDKGFLLATELYKHDYPFCWRCSTPVLYYARDSWFVAMSRLRDKLIDSNQKVHWVPNHVKNGRFGEWLKEVKDWNLSRERYWGTPIPIWRCASCKTDEVIGSLEQLEKRAKPFRNTYYAMRHAFPETVMLGVIDAGQGAYSLTPSGKKQAERAGANLKKTGIDLIVSSDILRTKETAQAVNEKLGVEIKSEPRFREINLGKIEGLPTSAYYDLIPDEIDRFKKAPEGGETLNQVRARVWSAIQDLEKEFSGKKILIVSHEYPIWMMTAVSDAQTDKEAIEQKGKKKEPFIKTGEVRKLEFKTVPRDEKGELDMHRPFIDEIEIPCGKCHGTMRRVKEVADCWFDSGSMPYASENYLLVDKKSRTKNLPIPYPADYICEAMDQTRGWFYTLLAVATALDLSAPYRNVVCLGLIHDKNGQKMSKSKGNVVNPWDMANKYGMDAVRWYFYTMNDEGEQKNFDETELAKSYRRYLMLLYNSFQFWRTYANGKQQATSDKGSAESLLDKWILARLAETLEQVEVRLEKFEIRQAALPLESMVDDLSRWYIRRSRRRLQKPESRKDFAACSQTLSFVLASLGRATAPFTPFFAEALYRGLNGKDLSVHLAEWPKISGKKQEAGDKEILDKMAEVRRLASLALAKRTETGVKVRQPLGQLKIKNYKLKSGDKELLGILAEEVNVKEIIVDNKLQTEIELDLTITPELKAEGMIRELVRLIQDLRAEAGFNPSDKIVLNLEIPNGSQTILVAKEEFLKKEVGAKVVAYGRTNKFTAEQSTDWDGQRIWLGVRKV